MTILISILVLGALIFVHEFGHFLVAKICGVAVLEFSIGFGRKIWRRRLGETSYSIGVVPLGGYVRMLGDEPAEQDSQAAQSSADTTQDASTPLEPVSEPIPIELLADRSRWFLEKSIAQRIAIVLAGPGFNYLFAALLAVFSVYIYGGAEMIDQPVIGEVVPSQPAQKSGLMRGDRIISIDGALIKTWYQMANVISESGGREMTVSIERKANVGTQSPQTKELKISGELESAEMQILNDSEAAPKYKIGILPEYKLVEVGLLESCRRGLYEVKKISEITLKGLWGMIKGAISPKNIAGPIFIFQEAANSAERGADHLLSFVILLSVSLAVLNLLPIPVLDGGHILFFLIEAIKGKPVSVRVQIVANQVGLLILLLLMIFAVGNDLMRLVG